MTARMIADDDFAFALKRAESDWKSNMMHRTSPKGNGCSGCTQKIPDLDTPLSLRGLQRSGTNYCEFLLRENYDIPADADIAKYKHRVEPPLDSEPPILLVVRHPIAWVVGFHRFAVDRRDTAEFHSWWSAERSLNEMAADYARLWNEKNGGWLPKAKGFVRHEDLIAAPETALDAACPAFGVTRKQGPFVTSGYYFHIKPTLSEQARTPFLAAEATAEHRAQFLSDAGLAAFADTLDNELLDMFRYRESLERLVGQRDSALINAQGGMA